MKNQLMFGASLLAMGVALGLPAWAEVDQTADVNFHVSGVRPADSADYTDAAEIRSNTTEDNTMRDAAGILQIQQVNGTGNAVGIAETVGEDVGTGTASQTELVVITVEDNETNQQYTQDDPSQLDRSNKITASTLYNAKGIADVQQNNGDANAMAIANNVLRQSGSDELNQTDTIAMSSSGNVSGANAVERSNTIDNDAFDSFEGIATVQQNNGDANGMVAGNDVILNDGIGGPITQTTVVSSSISGNVGTETDVISNNTLEGSFDGAAGLVDIQQNNGDGNIIVDKKKLVVVNDGLVNQANSVLHQLGGTVTDVTGGSRTNTIDGFMNAFQGAAGVQQNNGDANAMTLSKQIAVNFSDAPGVGPQDDVVQDVQIDADITGDFSGFFPSDPTYRDSDNVRTNDLTYSFGQADGIFNLQQNNGDGNSMAIADSLAINETQPENHGSVSQDVTVEGTQHRGTYAVDLGTSGTRTNNFYGSFNGASAFVAVQQNNGSANLMGIGSAVYVDTGEPDGIDGDSDFVAQNAQTTGEIGGEAGIASHYVGATSTADRQNRLNASFQSATGIVSLQQNNGDAGVMGIANAIALRQGTDDMFEGVDGEIVAQTSGTVDDVNVIEYKGSTSNLVGENSFNGFAGLANVQQNNSNSSVLGIANAVTIGEDTTDDFVEAPKTVKASGTAMIGVDGVVDASIHSFTVMENRIENGSFNNAEGIAAVQQVNGVGHVVGSSFSIFADVDTTDPGNTNATGANFGFGSIVQVAELDATISGVTVNEGGAPSGSGPTSTNVVSNSFRDYKGVARVQQVNGTGNAVMSAVTVVAAGLVKDPKTPYVPGLPGIDP